MRLPNRIKNIILQSVQDSFGPESVYLFGSRTNDTLRGRDIDIAIETSIQPDFFRTKRARFYTNLLRRGYNLKIDLVQYNSHIDALFKKEIDSNKIKLKWSSDRNAL